MSTDKHSTKSYCVNSSSNSSVGASSPNTLTKSGPTSKLAPVKSNGINDFPGKTENPTRRVLKSAWNISPLRVFDVEEDVISISLTGVCNFFHIENLSNASRDESIFLHLLFAHLASEAKLLSAAMLDVERPLNLLLKSMTERCQCKPPKS